MAETEVLLDKPQDPIEEMRGLIRGIHQNGYKDLDKMERFLVLYNQHAPDEERDSFFESLDSPDIEFEFWEGTFDSVVEAYDNLGGSRAAIAFPETGRAPSPDWTEELNALVNIFSSSEVEHGQSHALYARKHAKELEKADVGGEMYGTLLANPQFLAALANVYDFEANYEGTEHMPDDWPNRDDNFIDAVLRSVGYKYASSYRNDWRHASHAHEFVMDSLTPNLEAIASLEIERQGGVKYLSEQYGIRHFSRYPTELLVAQFDNGGKIGRPYGIAISAVDDHNGAFSGWLPNSSVPGRLYDQTQETHDLLVAEAETSVEFEQRLKHFGALNGDEFKIDFALIETHGSPSSIHFGAIPNLGSLALRSKLSDVGELFSTSSGIALTGCSTGQINGIAQSLSRQFNTTVVAPSDKGHTKNVLFMSDRENIRLIPEYSESQDGQTPMSVVYKNGSPLGPKKTTAYLRTD
jgi:hypothetical protein